MDAGATTSDGKLSGDIPNGIRVGFMAFYQRRNRALFTFLVNLVRERGFAEKVLSESMLDIWRQAGRFEGKSSAPTWLFSADHRKPVSCPRKKWETDEAAALIGDNAPRPDSLAPERGMSWLLQGMQEAAGMKGAAA